MLLFRKSGAQAKSRGFTLTELAIVLGIIGVILGAIWTAASRVYSNQKVTKAVTQTLAIAEAIKSTFPNGTTGVSNGTALTSFVIDGGKAPTDMIQTSCASLPYGTNAWAMNSNGTQCLVGPWQNQMAVGANIGFYGVAGNTREFEIITQGATMTAQQCVSYLSAIVPAAVNDGLINVYYNGAVIAVNSSTSPSQFSNCQAGTGILLQFQL